MNPRVGSWAARVAPVERSTAQSRATYDRLAPWYDWVQAPFERMSFTLELMATQDIPIVLQQCRRVLRDTGRIIVVSLALEDTPNLMSRLYLAAHRRWPRTIDRRPIPLHDVLPSSGFAVEETWAGSISGLPVTAISARR